MAVKEKKAETKPDRKCEEVILHTAGSLRKLLKYFQKHCSCVDTCDDDGSDGMLPNLWYGLHTEDIDDLRDAGRLSHAGRLELVQRITDNAVTVDGDTFLHWHLKYRKVRVGHRLVSWRYADDAEWDEDLSISPPRFLDPTRPHKEAELGLADDAFNRLVDNRHDQFFGMFAQSIRDTLREYMGRWPEGDEVEGVGRRLEDDRDRLGTYLKPLLRRAFRELLPYVNGDGKGSNDGA